MREAPDLPFAEDHVSANLAITEPDQTKTLDVRQAAEARPTFWPVPKILQEGQRRCVGAGVLVDEPRELRPRLVFVHSFPRSAGQRPQPKIDNVRASNAVRTVWPASG